MFVFISFVAFIASCCAALHSVDRIFVVVVLHGCWCVSIHSPLPFPFPCRIALYSGSALKRDGKKLYELGRKGQTAEEIKIEAREVVIHDLKLIRPDRSGDSDSDAASEPPRIEKFEIEVECGGGTYIRSLVRDIGIELGTVATMTALERTKQGRFLPEHCIPYQLLGDEPKEQKTQGSDEKTGTVFIDKKEDCNWTVETITEGIRVCRSNVLGSSDDDDDDDGLK